MPRPCIDEHPLSPRSCRVCQWCADISERGAVTRRAWGEPDLQPDSVRESVYSPRYFVPGLLDPIPDPEFSPVPDWWPHDPKIIQRHRDSLLELARQEFPPLTRRIGAGVLMLGGGKFWPGNVLSVKMLRESGSVLPVQIWHRGEEEPVIPSDLRGISGVEIRDLHAIRPEPRILRGWDAKTLAILACGWERVLFLDADAYCLSDPTPLLDRLSLEEPLLFWEDHPNGQNNLRLRTWGIDRSTVPPIQGGQFALHTTYFQRELILAHWIDQHSDFTYFHQHGDQDSWRLALSVTGGRYARLGGSNWDGFAFTCHFEDRPLIIHRCLSKWFYPEDVPGHIYRVKRLTSLPGEDRAWAIWNGLLAARSAENVFGRMYGRGEWGPHEVSGPGSSHSEAKPYIELMNALIKLSGWKRVIDLGCGDGYIASQLDAPEVIGVDCYGKHIARHQKQWPKRSWMHLDLDRDREKLPEGDIAFLKDVLLHWPNQVIGDWLDWARKAGKWKWVVCTQDNSQEIDGQDCLLGGLRPLHIEKEPLKSLKLTRLCDFLRKSVLLLKCE